MSFLFTPAFSFIAGGGGWSSTIGSDFASSTYDSVTKTLVGPTGTYDSGVSQQTQYPIGLNADGTKMYTVGNGNLPINEFALSAAYDLSTAGTGTYTGIDVERDYSLNINASGGFFTDNGNRLIIYHDDQISQYSLSTAYDAGSVSAHDGTTYRNAGGSDLDFNDTFPSNGWPFSPNPYINCLVSDLAGKYFYVIAWQDNTLECWQANTTGSLIGGCTFVDSLALGFQYTSTLNADISITPDGKFIVIMQPARDVGGTAADPSDIRLVELGTGGVCTGATLNSTTVSPNYTPSNGSTSYVRGQLLIPMANGDLVYWMFHYTGNATSIEGFRTTLGTWTEQDYNKIRITNDGFCVWTIS